MRRGRTVSRRTRQGTRLVAGVAVVLVVVTLLGGAPVRAHAVVVSTSPPAGALLAETPTEVAITFSEPVQIDDDSIVVVDADGTVVSGPTEIAGATVRATLPDPIQGWHAVSWRAVSIDGHPISGAWTFRVGGGDDVAPAGLEDRAAAAARPSTPARWGFYLGQWMASLATAVLVGTLFVMTVVASSPRLRRLAVVAAAVGVVASVAAAAANGPYASAATALFAGPASDEYLLRAGLVAVAGVLMVLADPVASRRARAGRVTALALAVPALAVPISAGHAGSDGGPATIAVAAHLVVASCWLGAIPAMFLLVREGGERARHLAAFSAAATWLLAGTLLAGVAGVQLLTGGIPNATQTWGWSLFAKLGIIGVAIAAGAWNRWNVVPRADELSRPEATVALRVEIVALVAIVAASVALTHNGPPAQAATATGGPAVVDEVVDGVRVQVVVDPARVGTNDLHLFLLDDTGMGITAEEVTIHLSSPVAGVGRIEVPLTDLGAGHHSTRTDDLGVPGTWTVDVVVRPDPFTQVELTAEVEVAP